MTDDISRLVPDYSNPHWLALRYLERHGRNPDGDLTVRFWQGQWWRYGEGHYTPVSTDSMDRDLTKVVKDLFTEHRVRGHNERLKGVTQTLVGNANHALKSEAGIPDETSEPSWIGKTGPTCISMKNGLVVIDTLLAGAPDALLPHSPAYFNRVQLPYDYDPTASCPRWLKFLREVMENDAERVALLQEWFGLCLTYNTRFHNFIFFEGEGANGKGVTTDVLTRLVGEENVSNVGLERFGERFAFYPTLGKLINICNEVEVIDKKTEAKLKSFTGQDRIEFERKFKDAFYAQPTARVVLVGNERPEFKDRSLGIWRRMILVPFRVHFPEGVADPHLREKLAEELPGIFRWAVEGLRRLTAQGSFTVSRVCAEALAQYRNDSNPERLFLAEVCELGPGNEVPCQKLYAEFCSWATEAGLGIPSAAEFGTRIKHILKQDRSRPNRDGKRFYVYKGVGLRESVHPVPALPFKLSA